MFVEYTHCTGLGVSLQSARPLRCGHSLQHQMVQCGQGMPLCWLCSTVHMPNPRLRHGCRPQSCVHLYSEYLILPIPQRHKLHWESEASPSTPFSREGCMVEMRASEALQKARREPEAQSQARGQVSVWRIPTLHFPNPRLWRWLFSRLESVFFIGGAGRSNLPSKSSRVLACHT